MQAETLLQLRLVGVLLYLHSDIVTAHSGFASTSLRPLIAVGQAMCPLHSNVASSSPLDTIAARKICVSSISADCLIASQATCPLCCNMAFSY